MASRSRTLLVALVTLFVLLTPIACRQSHDGGSPAAPSGPGAARVTRVVDGDTIVVDLGGHDETVRLLGIDTPETKHPTKPVQCFGKEASEQIAALLPAGTDVRLERDDEERDTYGRLLAYVYRSSDDLFVNLDLVQKGFASLLTIRPNVTHLSDFTAAESRARADGLGLWGRCGGPGRPAT